MTDIIRHRKHKIMHGAVEHNGVLYFGGHAANDLSQGMANQTREVCSKLEAFLHELGSDKTKIIAARIYLSDISQKDEMNKAWLEWIPEDHLPSRATIGIASLGDPNRLIEVIITAAR
jgi:enamine deaminase RidA (YjgF/YER057c/UK114 family)